MSAKGTTKKGQAKVQRKKQPRHRAKKGRPVRPLDMAQPNNHAVRHEAKKARLAAEAEAAAKAAAEAEAAAKAAAEEAQLAAEIAADEAELRAMGHQLPEVGETK